MRLEVWCDSLLAYTELKITLKMATYSSVVTQYESYKANFCYLKIVASCKSLHLSIFTSADNFLAAPAPPANK